MGFLTDFIGGAAQTGENILQSQMTNEALLGRQKQMAEFNSDLEAKKLATIEELRIKRAEELRKNQIRARMQAQEQIDLRATQIGQEREVGSLQKMQGLMAGEAPAASAEELLAASKTMRPEHRAEYEKLGLINSATPLSQLDDQATAARQLGAYENLEAIHKQRSDVLAQTREENRDKRAREEAARREAKDEAQAKRWEQQHQESMERIAKAGGKDSDSTKQALSFIDGLRKELASDAANLKSMYATDTKDLSPAKKKIVQDEYKSKFDAIARKRAQVESDFNALREKIGLPKSESSIETAKPPASNVLPKRLTFDPSTGTFK